MSSSTWFRTVATAAILVALTSPALSAGEEESAGGALDGKTYSGELVAEGKEAGDADNLVFADGMFRSTACDKYHYGSAPYTTTAGDGSSLLFEAETDNGKGERMVWSGTVDGDTLTGTASWYKGERLAGTYHFTGSLAE